MVRWRSGRLAVHGDTAGAVGPDHARFAKRRLPRGNFAVPNPGNSAPPIPEFPQNGNIKISAFTLPNVIGVLNTVNLLDLNNSVLYASVSRAGWFAPRHLQDGDRRPDLDQRHPAGQHPLQRWQLLNAILAIDANIVLVAGQGVNANGQDTIIQTSDGGLTWFDISGGGPHAGIHGMSLDSQRRVLVSTDGGLWRLNTNGTWDQPQWRSGHLARQRRRLEPGPTTTVFAGSQANGTDKFSNNQTWNRADGYGGGRVAVDPNNSQTIYAVSLLTGTNATLRKSTDGGTTWTSVLAIGSPTAPLVLDTVNSAASWSAACGSTSRSMAARPGSAWHRPSP